MNKLTNEDFVKRFIDKFGDDEFEVVSEYVKWDKNIKIQHKKCGFEFDKRANRALNSDRIICSNCEPHANNRLYPYINDIWATNKEVYDLLENKEDGHKYKAYSNNKTWFICPFCGEKVYAKIGDVTRKGLSCKRCGDGISFPEKFMYNMLKQLNITSEKEYRPKWLNGRKFDFLFEFNSNKYVIETDGSLGHGNKTFKGEDDTIGKIIDNEKDMLAQKHGIIVIRIDCNYIDTSKRFDYIKNSILNSELNNLFDLSKVDFNECLLYAESSLLRKAAELWNSGINDTYTIAEKLGVIGNTACNYLKRACDLDLISITKEELVSITRKNGLKRAVASRKKNGNYNCTNKYVLCIETGEVFSSYKDAGKKYKCSIAGYFYNNGSYAGKLPDGTKLHWEKLNKKEAEKLLNL